MIDGNLAMANSIVFGGPHDNEPEGWADIPGYEGLYRASTLGNIFSIRSSKNLKTKSNGTGYMQVELNVDGVEKLKYVHRLVMSAFKGESELPTDHLNGIRNDNRLLNLEYVTTRENQTRRRIKKKVNCPVGTSYESDRGKFKAEIMINGSKKVLGRFDTAEEASEAYQCKLKEITNEKRK